MLKQIVQIRVFFIVLKETNMHGSAWWKFVHENCLLQTPNHLLINILLPGTLNGGSSQKSSQQRVFIQVTESHSYRLNQSIMYFIYALAHQS